MRRVFIESPYAGEVDANLEYARRCMLDCLQRGEAPFAGHLLYPQVLNDVLPSERAQGMSAAFEWAVKADAIVVYTDRGVSPGMFRGVKRAIYANQVIEFRSLGNRKETK